jgi:hypothetical protein
METMELLYIIQLSNGNYSYVYTDKEGNILPNDDEEIHYYVNDLEDFYDNEESSFDTSKESSFLGTTFSVTSFRDFVEEGDDFNSSGVNISFNNLLI